MEKVGKESVSSCRNKTYQRWGGQILRWNGFAKKVIESIKGPENPWEEKMLR